MGSAKGCFFFNFKKHVVFMIVTVMHWIPDVPKIIQDQIERENLITQRALWEVKPELRSPSTTFSTLFTNKDRSAEINIGEMETEEDFSNFDIIENENELVK